MAARLKAISVKRRVTAYLRAQVTVNDGKPVLAWHSGVPAVDAEAAADGWYAPFGIWGCPGPHERQSLRRQLQRKEPPATSHTGSAA